MLIPAAWENHEDIEDEVRDFYRYHGCLMEAWDGPAGLIFTDGEHDRRGHGPQRLRPLRYSVCEDGFVACSSEAGSIYTRGHGTVRRGKVGPGEMILLDPVGRRVHREPGRRPAGQAHSPTASGSRNT